MPKTHQFDKGQQDEVKELMSTTTNASVYRKLEVLQLRMEGYKNAEISKITKYSKSRVSALVCIYANEGISYFEKENRIGGNHRNISFDEESKLLETYKNAAEKGQVITVGEIKAAYDEKCGHGSGSGTIYQVIERHGWRKIMPRSKHPNKANEEAIEASKKLTSESEN